MSYVVFSVEKSQASKINKILKDDLVSRQSISVRDASALNIDKDVRYVVIEGTDEAIKKADELFSEVGKKEDEEEAKNIYNKIKSEEGDVAQGVGLIFGD
ncbi:MAG: hypothetical protein JSV09_05390 [Thermoplasmata archaeon]|nr:MAG: hypothetical protein JSV09_05390 [Thermoplasmata archaeon]